MAEESSQWESNYIMQWKSIYRVVPLTLFGGGDEWFVMPVVDVLGIEGSSKGIEAVNGQNNYVSHTSVLNLNLNCHWSK